MDPKVQETLALLQQAGRLDLLKEEVLAPCRPARRASAGVGVVVAACSPPLAAREGQVRGEGRKVARGAGPRASGVFRGWARGGGPAPGSPRAVLRESKSGGLRSGWKVARRSPVLKRYRHKPRVGQRKAVGAPNCRGAGTGIGAKAAAERDRSGPREQLEEGAGLGDRVYGSSRAVAVGGSKGSLEGAGMSHQLEAGGMQEQRDPRVPVSKKWPTMLVWSSSDEEGASGEAVDYWSGGEGALTAGIKEVSRNGQGCQRGVTSGEEDGSSGDGGNIGEGETEEREVVGGFGSPGTPDLLEQGPLDFDEDDPGEQGAALVPWDEEKAGPRSASRMASSGRCGRRRRAAEASSGRCGSVGDAPSDAAAWEEQCPGPAYKWKGNARGFASCACCGGQGEQVWRKGAVREERMSDVSLEEGELPTSGSETEWWERQGRGVSNPVLKSLQVSHAGRRTKGGSQERLRGEERKAQERPPLLSPDLWQQAQLADLSVVGSLNSLY
ncbi:hypothetical protein NDU88_011784 [Pleurodeles waltl]|uniref:Uncharacterized protein n=1 Tax=Pleurodeles waltl TaxID=8319 RepID=A0AAV7R409_PLEWA|nr:hypothetical protein NDU88_011784 [Pleurodeles waltl]